MQMQDESELLQAALKDIAYALIQDSDAKELDLMSQSTHVHLSATSQIPQKLVFSFHLVASCFLRKMCMYYVWMSRC